MQQDRNKAWGFSLFCDDVRFEVGGKVTLIGLYQNELIASSAPPIVIPKFVIMIMYYELKNSITSDITFVILAPDQEGKETQIAEAKIERSQISVLEPSGEASTEELIWSARIPISLSPFIIPAHGTIRVRARYDDGAELRLGSLRVRSATQDELSRLTAVAPAPSGG